MIRKTLTLYTNASAWLERNLDCWFFQLFARFVFAAVLFFYFFNAGINKTGEGLFGIFNPTIGAYAAILPSWMEAVSFDISQLSFVAHLIVILGTTAEIVLPVLIVVGLMTRLAALGMTGFIFVQSIVDIHGHNLSKSDSGAWFDGFSDGLIFDQRLFWILCLTLLIVKGSGKFSLDYLLGIEKDFRQQE